MVKTIAVIGPCFVTPGDIIDNLDTLIKALQEFAELNFNPDKINEVVIEVPDIPQLTLSPRDAFYGETETIPFQESADRIIAEFIYVYPPGIPILLPGEVITQDLINYIVDHVEVGLPVKGPEDRSVQNVKVIVETQAIF